MAGGTNSASWSSSSSVLKAAVAVCDFFGFFAEADLEGVASMPVVSLRLRPDLGVAGAGVVAAPGVAAGIGSPP